MFLRRKGSGLFWFFGPVPNITNGTDSENDDYRYDCPIYVELALLGLLGAFALYSLISFVHWAWTTPMPFVGNS